LRKKVKPRRYESPIRAEAAERTRQRILDAARALFIEQGYAAMTMQAVADTAGVALDTVYATVGKKPLLARLLVETAISNTDHEVPAEQRAYVQRVRAAPSAREKLEIYAVATTEIQARLAPLVRALEAASTAHPDLGAMWCEIAERRAQNMKKLAAELMRTGEVRAGLAADRIADTLWVGGSPQLFTLLVGERGWSEREYAAWLADTWRRLLL
jgi:AcrR family transcriptional regulator